MREPNVPKRQISEKQTGPRQATLKTGNKFLDGISMCLFSEVAIAKQAYKQQTGAACRTGKTILIYTEKSWV